MSLSLLTAMLLAAPTVEPVFSYDRPFVYNSAATLKKDDLLFPIVLGYPSPQMLRRNFAFGLTDKLTVESSLMLNLMLHTNLRAKLLMVNSDRFLMSISPELVYAPDTSGNNQDYTILGIRAPMTVKLDRGSFLSLTPGYRHAVKGLENLDRFDAQEILRVGVNQPGIDMDYLMVVDDYSAIALNAHFTIPVGGATLNTGHELGPYTVFTGKMEYLRGVGKHTRVGLAILYNPQWIPSGFEPAAGDIDADFLPQLSLWWRIPTRPKPKKRSVLLRGTNSKSISGKLKAAPVALPLPPVPAATKPAAKPEPKPAPKAEPAPAPAPEPAPETPAEPAPAPEPEPGDK